MGTACHVREPASADKLQQSRGLLLGGQPDGSFDENGHARGVPQSCCVIDGEYYGHSSPLKLEKFKEV